jgi:hypothetical protein
MVFSTHRSTSMMEFSIVFADGEEETGVCLDDCDDVVYFIREAFKKGEEVTLRLTEHDPTPEIMPIGEMF